MESLQELKNVKKKTTAVADVGEQTAATNAIADAARTTSAAEVAATAAVSDEAEKTARNESITTKYSETNIVVRSRAVNIQSAQKKMAGLWQCTAPKPFEIGTPNFLGILLWSLIRSGRNFNVLSHENSPLRSI
jgi:hypothetical protein